MQFIVLLLGFVGLILAIAYISYVDTTVVHSRIPKTYKVTFADLRSEFGYPESIKEIPHGEFVHTKNSIPDDFVDWEQYIEGYTGPAAGDEYDKVSRDYDEQLHKDRGYE